MKASLSIFRLNMVKINFKLFIFLLLSVFISSKAFASVTPYFAFLVEITMNDGKTHKGYYTRLQDVCKFDSKQQKFYYYYYPPSGGGEVDRYMTTENLKEDFLRAKERERERIESIKSKYLPKMTGEKKIATEASIRKREAKLPFLELYKELYDLKYADGSSYSDYYRMARKGYIEKDLTKIKIDQIKEIKVISCTDIETAPAISLTKREVELMSTPSKAVFADEQSSKGSIILVSYNEKIDTHEKVKALLESFVAGKEKPAKTDTYEPTAWWYAIYDIGEVAKFRKSLPKDVYFFIYYVED